MTVKSITRNVMFDTTKLKDIPGLSVQALKEFYARLYPEILTATVKETVSKDGIDVRFETACLTKG